MSGLLSYSIALLIGFALGGVFFSGLLATILALPNAKYPAALALGSLALRSALVVLGILFAMQGRWQNGLVCLVGFSLARLLVVRWAPGRTASLRSRAGPAASGGRGVVSS